MPPHVLFRVVLRPELCEVNAILHALLRQAASRGHGAVRRAELLDPRSTWSDPVAYDHAATELAEKFRTNDAKFTLDDAVRASGPTV